MAYNQTPGRGNFSQFENLKTKGNPSLINGDPPNGSKKSVEITGSSADYNKAVKIQHLASSNILTPAAKKWIEENPEAYKKALAKKKASQKDVDIKQVPIKSAVEVESGANVRDVKGVPLVETQETQKEKKKRGGSSMHSKGRLGMQMKQFFKSKNRGGQYSTKFSTSCRKGKC